MEWQDCEFRLHVWFFLSRQFWGVVFMYCWRKYIWISSWLEVYSTGMLVCVYGFWSIERASKVHCLVLGGFEGLECWLLTI